MEIETETEVATAAEAVDTVKYIDTGGDQMQNIIIQVAPQDQEMGQEPQRIVIPAGLENYVVQLAEQEQPVENVQLYQSIQPRTIYPKVETKVSDKITQKLNPVLIKPSPVIQHTQSKPIRPVPTAVRQPPQPKVMISQKHVKHQRKRPAPQTEKTEYIYVSRVPVSPKTESNETGKSIYNTIKVYKSAPNKEGEKQVEELPSHQGIWHQMAYTESHQTATGGGNTAQPVSNEEATTLQVTASSQPVVTVKTQGTLLPQRVSSAPKQVATPSQPVALTTKEVASTTQTIVSTTLQVASTAQPIVSTTLQVASTAQPIVSTTLQVASTAQPVATSSQIVASLSKQLATVASTSQQLATVASPSQQETSVAAQSQPVASTSQPMSEFSQQTEEVPEEMSQQLSATAQEPKVISNQSALPSQPTSTQTKQTRKLLLPSKEFIRKGGNIFKIDPISKKIIFEPASPKSLEESAKNSEKSASDDDLLEEEHEAKKSKVGSWVGRERNNGRWLKKTLKEKQEAKKEKKKALEEKKKAVSEEKKAIEEKKKAIEEKKKRVNEEKTSELPRKVGRPRKEQTKSNKDTDDRSKEMSVDDLQIKQEVVEDFTESTQNQKTPEEEEEELEDQKCRMCLSLHNAECPLMRRRVILSISDNESCLNSSMLSLQSIPPEFLLSRRKGHGMSVFASDIIQKGTHFGPVQGEFKTFEQISHKMDFTHLWLIETEDTIKAVNKREVIYNFISTADEMKSNWCRYLRTTLNPQKCNVISYCKNEQVWFVAREDIQEGEELIVYFRFIEDLQSELWFADLLNRKEKLCQRCDVVYTNLVNYVKHVQVYHPYSLKKLKAICKECGLVLESTGELTQHCKDEHQGNGAFVCKDCGKQFPIPRGLQQHRKFHHIVEGNFQCEHCGKSFCNRFKLKNHMRAKHSGKEFRCDICKKVVGSRTALHRHRKTHTKEGYKFTCDRCGKSCRDNSNLRSHMLSHLKARKFPCMVAGCIMRYGSKVALQLHLVKTHFLTAEKIKVHMLTLLNDNEQNDSTQKEQQEKENSAIGASGTQTEIMYELESDEDVEWYD
ncbi:uncharacterized protein [Argopecten irradians]|uniref:uncharacterized protein isoform X1 n=1 Tax=Argopecten irradians TaxID=31199 RepID=UPI003714C75D